MSDKDFSDCVHEAGHAVLRYLRGDTLLSVQASVGGDSTARMGARGCTNSRAKQRECSNCGGYVRNHSPEIDPTGTGSAVSLNANCKECVDVIVTRLAAVYAGDIAAKILTPADHNPRDAQFDELDIDDLFRQLPFPILQRQSLKRRGKALAIDTVAREQKAILALAKTLKDAGGFLNGEDASKIIRENLTSTELQG